MTALSLAPYLLALASFFMPLSSHAQSAKLEFSTLLGGSGEERSYLQKLVIDTHRNIFTMGTTESLDFPFTPGAYDSTYNRLDTVFVTKLDATGSSIIYSTYLTGSGREKPTGFQVDDEGNAYISGATRSVGYPRTPGSYFSDVYFDVRESIERVFLTKLNSIGSKLVYSIVFGDKKNIQSMKGDFLGLDGEGHAYVMGDAGYGEIATTPGALQVQPSLSNSRFVCKFSRDGSKLEYATYFGGPTKGPQINAFAVDRTGNAYIGGGYAAEDFPLTANCYSADPLIPPNYQFLSKINPSGSQLVYSTFLALIPNVIAVDDSENVCIGYNSQRFPVTPGAYNRDIFQEYGICKFSFEGNSVVFSTRTFGYKDPFPGWDFDMHGIAVDSSGKVYLVGNNAGKVTLPTTPDAFDGSFNGGNSDIYFCVFDAAGSKLLYATYFGGSGEDYCSDLKVTGSGDVYLTGFTTSRDFPTTEGALSRTLKGGSDSFVCKFSFDSTPVHVEDTPRAFHLFPAHPNPFNPSTTISFTLPAPSRAELAVYSITGQRVRTLISGSLTMGKHTAVWDGRDDSGKPVSSGVYLSRLTAGKQTATGRMVLVK